MRADFGAYLGVQTVLEEHCEYVEKTREVNGYKDTGVATPLPTPVVPSSTEADWAHWRAEIDNLDSDFDGSRHEIPPPCSQSSLPRGDVTSSSQEETKRSLRSPKEGNCRRWAFYDISILIARVPQWR